MVVAKEQEGDGYEFIQGLIVLIPGKLGVLN